MAFKIMKIYGFIVRQKVSFDMRQCVKKIAVVLLLRNFAFSVQEQKRSDETNTISDIATFL